MGAIRNKKLGILLAVIGIGIIIGIMIWFETLLDERYSAEELKLAEDAVRKYAVQCYALEGEYPKDLKYLTDNYTLTLNEEEFVYHYEYIGGNMMPEIAVFVK